jgi:hypothetical protein
MVTRVSGESSASIFKMEDWSSKLFETCQQLPTELRRIRIQKTTILKHSSLLCYNEKTWYRRLFEIDSSQSHSFIHSLFIYRIQDIPEQLNFLSYKRNQNSVEACYFCASHLLKLEPFVKFFWKFVWDTPAENSYTTWIWLIRNYIFFWKTDISYIYLGVLCLSWLWNGLDG